jgi:hypothetical protein
VGALFAMVKFDPRIVEQIVRWHVNVLERSPIYREILEKGIAQGLEEGLEQVLVNLKVGWLLWKDSVNCFPREGGKG